MAPAGKKRKRAPKVALGTALFLLVSFNSIPSVPSIPDSGPPPSLEEVALLEQLSQWLLGGSEPGSFRLGEAGSLGGGRQGFELFPRRDRREANRKLLQGLPFGNAIFQAAQRYRIDSLLLAAMVETESSFKADAVSPRGAVGLMQVLPETALRYGGGDVSQPAVNLDVGARYFSSLLRQFSGDLELALAAYNAGPGAVQRHGGVPPYRETQAYVERVLTRYVDHHQRIWEPAIAGIAGR